MALAQSAEAQSVRYVDQSAPPGGSGLSWSTAYRDLQSAIAQAGATEIRCAQGVYRPDGGSNDRAAKFVLRNNLTIRGGYAGLAGPVADANDPELYPTTLSGDIGQPGVSTDNTYRVVVGAGLDATAVLENLSISGGVADGGSPNSAGGALALTGVSQASGATIRNVRLVQNSGSSGGAVYISQTAPRFFQCVFAENSATSNGGAIQAINAAPVFEDCLFASNAAQTGGAASFVFCNTSVRRATITDNLAQIGGGGIHANLGTIRIESTRFEDNRVLGTFTSADGGGAFYFDHVASAAVVDSALVANLSYRGGGAGAVACGTTDQAAFAGCSFFENTAATDGGAMLFTGGSPTLMNVVFSGNFALSKGGAMHVNGANPSVWFGTFFANVAQSVSGGGINVGSGLVTLSGSILWGNRNSAGVSEAAQVNDPANHAQVRSSCFQYWSGRYPGNSNIWSSPLFQNAAGLDGVTGTRDDDLRLASGSPAIDACDSSLIPADIADADGNLVTAEPLAVDRVHYLRRVDAPQASDVGAGAAPLPDMGAYEYRCPADVNFDGQLDLADFFEFMADFDQSLLSADIDGDGNVDLSDFFEFLMLFDASCA